MRDYCIAFMWGLAEATFFFFIPDIYLTKIAITQPRKAIIACFVAAIAAMLGGSLMYAWAMMDSQQAYRFLTFIPGIFPNLILTVVDSIQHQPFYALFIAPLKGIPYKIYAVAFGAEKLNATLFMVTSFFARLCRFLLITSVGALIAMLLKHYVKEKTVLLIFILTWGFIYMLYFCLDVYFYY